MTPRSQLMQEAHALDEAGRYREARDAFLVAADAAEEEGKRTIAWALRLVARKMHIADWARKKFPTLGIRSSHVFPRPPTLDVRQAMNEEVKVFLIRSPFFDEALVVSVDRRGRVRRVT